MPNLSQSQFTRAVRGAPGTLDPAEIEPVIGGISSQARSALRQVHRDSPAAALAYFDTGVAKHAGTPAWRAAQAYRGALQRYIAWNQAVGRTFRTDGDSDGIDVKLDVPFGPGNAVRTWCHVALEDGSGGSEARIVLWDELSVTEEQAEMIALPVLEAADARYGAGSTSVVKVWQLALNQPRVVPPPAAQARRNQIQALIAGL